MEIMYRDESVWSAELRSGFSNGQKSERSHLASMYTLQNNPKYNALDGEFAVARMETGGSTMLLSEVIRCVLNEVSIQFNLWLTGTAKLQVSGGDNASQLVEYRTGYLQVCLVDESTPSLLDCQPASSGPVVVDLPRIERPFRIALRAESPDQGMVIVDDIRVQVSSKPCQQYGPAFGGNGATVEQMSDNEDRS